MGARLKSIEDVQARVARHPAKDSLTLGQVVCLGLEDLKARVGHQRWRRTEELVVHLIETAVEEILGPEDSFMRSRDGSYLIVFGSGNPDIAEARAARIATLVNRRLFGEDDADGLMVQNVVATSEGLEGGESRNPASIIEALLTKAQHMSMSDDHRQPACARGDGVRADKGNEARGAPADGGDALHGGGHRFARPNDVREALLQEFTSLSAGTVRFAFRPVWQPKMERNAVFHCVPLKDSLIEGEPYEDYRVLGADPGRDEIAELDFGAMEVALLAQSRRLAQGGRQMVSFNLHFETLSTTRRRNEAIALLDKAPRELCETLLFQIVGIPEGVTEGRLAEIIRPLQGYARDVVALIDLTGAQSPSAGQLARLRAAGLRCVVIRLPDCTSPVSAAAMRNMIAALRRSGIRFGVSNVALLKTQRMWKREGANFFVGALFGGPFDQLPSAYQYPVSEMSLPTSTALVYAKFNGHDVETWQRIAAKFDVAFATISADDGGVPRFELLSEGIDDLLGYAPDELVGKPMHALYAGETDKVAATEFLDRLRTSGEANVCLKAVTRDGDEKVCRMVAMRAPHAHRQPQGIFYAYLEDPSRAAPRQGQRDGAEHAHAAT
ncbi:PAS domain-containing protein [Thalassobaculum litoreum]|uniref:PAS domain-containing protein n=1 Tax=Thalassobaculum litoreum DSM 18839 TaxID=1123362 RepID=A0A8G2EVL5_9PROT|nr:PAS domain-containing protein [Thalassobaculum litoreum]SDF89348.1 hypothetical protein SAMN05660686_02720 [Thalassobaculum litoreum DSM 18839]